MQNTLFIALRVTVVTLILTGVIYPFVLIGLAQVLFPWRANGSLVTDDRGQVVGSELIGQGFTHPAYFQPRPSAAGTGYDATVSSGSNLGPTSKKSQDRVNQDLARLKEENPAAQGEVPIELVTTSGSGLDPHLSLRAVLWQLPRVAHARGVAPERVQAAVEAAQEGRDLWLLGEPRVNVLRLNLALDRHFGHPAPAQVRERKEQHGERSVSAQPTMLIPRPAGGDASQ